MDEMNVKTVNLRDLWELLIQRLWVMALAAVVCVAGLFIVKQVTYVPQYSSTATLYILRQNAEGQVSGTDSDFSLALKVVNDCTYLLKSHAVVDQVIENMDLEMSYAQLYERISTKNPDSTRILEVKVVADTPEQAKAIVDSLCQIGQQKIMDAMGFQQVNFYERGTLETEPCNRTGLLTYALVGIIAAVLTYSVFLVLLLVDDRIRSEADIQQILGLSVLGDIPCADGTVAKKPYGYGLRPQKRQRGNG